MKNTAIVLTTIAMATVSSISSTALADDVEIMKVKAEFETVKQDVADAIIDRGFLIDYNAKIGAMLNRTGSDVGSTKRIFNHAETVQFCSAILSRKMMEPDPENIAYCPFIVFYYERADEPGTVYVGYRELDEDGSADSKTAKKAINKLLDTIVKEATGG